MAEQSRVTVQTLRRYAKLYKEKEALKAKLAKAEADMKGLEEPVVQYFQRHTMQRQTVEGVTLFIRRELWPGMKETSTPERLCDALEESGLGRVAARRMNHQSMRGIVNEAVGDSQGNPEEIFHEAYPLLRDHVKVSETFKVGTRKA